MSMFHTSGPVFHTVEGVLAMVREGVIRVAFKTTQVNLQSLRMRNFAHHGVACVECGRVGTQFRIQPSNNSQPHLNLFSEDGVLMTRDHIVPRVLGGPDTLDNLQTMCAPCNEQKGGRPLWSAGDQELLARLDAELERARKDFLGGVTIVLDYDSVLLIRKRLGEFAKISWRSR